MNEDPQEPESTPDRRPLDRRRVVQLAALGLVAGTFSGLFGIGGGVIVLPALVVLLGMNHKQAVGTSLVAIFPAALVSLISYGVAGSVDLVTGAVLSVGAVAGAQLGALVMDRLSRRTAQWVFIGFVAVMIVQLLVVVPTRGAAVHLTWVVVVGLLALGVVAGFASTILGVGGGGIVVPVLMLLFGVGDVVAKGASLFMMIPGTASGLWANARRKTVDWHAGLVVGGAAVLTGPFGSWVAHLIAPQLGSWLFAGFLTWVGYSMVRRALRPGS